MKLARVVDYAESYIELGWSLIWCQYLEKRPGYDNWQNEPIDNAAAARQIWSPNPRRGIGVLLAPSQLLVLDIDHVEYCRQLFDSLGLSLDEMSQSTVSWTGRPERLKLMFRAPPGFSLRRRALSWPLLNQETGELEMTEDGEQVKRKTVIEFRGGHGFQDILPPTVHPDTGQPYRWLNNPWEFPIAELPDTLMNLWRDWNVWLPRLEALCPWAPPPPVVQSHKPFVPTRSAGNAADIIGQYNAQHSLESLLETHGYIPKGKRRYLHPDSTTNSPGVHLYSLSGGWVCYSHHGGQCRLADGHAHDSFDVFRLFEHGGDWRKALQAGAEGLGLTCEAPTKPGTVAAIHDIVTGERIEGQPQANWTEQLTQTARGGVERSVSNLVLILENALPWQGVIARNLFSARIEKAEPPPYEAGEKGLWSDDDNAETAVWITRSYGITFTSAMVHEAVRLVANHNAHHPVKDYLKECHQRWDGLNRIDKWLVHYLGAIDNEYHRTIGKKWLLAAVTRIFEPGCKYDQILVLEGHQGIGKSSVLAVLGQDWFSDAHLDLHSKDSVILLLGKWIIEMPELASLNRAELEVAKAYFARREDGVRFPYDRIATEIKRSCVIAATCNHHEYLDDDSGNRRFLPVLVNQIELDLLRQDVHQIWGEAVALYWEGSESYWYRKAPRFIEQEQEMRYRAPAWEELIAAWLAEPDNWETVTIKGEFVRYVTLAQVMIHACGIKAGMFNDQQQKKIVKILQRFGLRLRLARVNGESRRIYHRASNG